MVLPQGPFWDPSPAPTTLIGPHGPSQDFTPALEILTEPHQSHMSLRYLRVTTHVTCRTAPRGSPFSHMTAPIQTLARHCVLPEPVTGLHEQWAHP